MSLFETPPKVLIIDDDSKDLQYLGTILQEQNYQIFLANDGEEGLKRTQKVQPDIVLLDLVLPGLEGFEVLSKLKKEPKTQNIPVIIISGKTSTEDFEKGFSLGAADFLHKPFNSSELLTRVYNQLYNYRTKRELEDKIRESKQLLQIVGHDLSNQLVGVTEILEVGKSDQEELYKNLPLIEESITNAKTIVELIKDFIFLEGRKKVWDLSSVPLKVSVISVVNQMAYNFKKKDIKIDYSGVPEKVCVMVHQPSFVQSVLPNLLSNCFKFSPIGSTVEILAKEEKDHVVIQIKDQGIGIPENILTSLFSLEGIKKSREGTGGEMGTGYGLPLVKKFIDAYGGHIRIQSQEGKGTSVFLTLRKGMLKEVNI